MKLIKKDRVYSYYRLSERDQDTYWTEADVVAIENEDLKYKSAKDAMCDGDYEEIE